VTDAADATKGSVTINVDDCMDSTPAKHDLSIVELSVCDPATGAVKKVKVLASAPY